MAVPGPDDDLELDFNALAVERIAQQLDPVRSALVEMAGRNANFLGADHLEELYRRAAREGFDQDKARFYLEKWVHEYGIRLSGPLLPPSPVAPDLRPREHRASPLAPALSPIALPSPLPPPSLPPRWCPRCFRTGTDRDQFCGKCGLPLLCPRCRHAYSSGSRFCPGCGLDPLTYQQYREFADAGRQLLEDVRTQTDCAARLRLAEQAREAFASALQCNPADAPLLKPQAEEARRLVAEALWEQSEAAIRDRLYSLALSLLGRLAADPAEAARADARAEKIRILRTDKLGEARAEATRGQWEKAVALLAALAECFPEDADIARLLEEHRRNAALVRDVASRQVPELSQARRLVALLEVFQELEKKRLNLGWLTERLETCRQAVRRADEFAEGASRLALAGRPQEALREADRALELVADHPLALLVRAQVEVDLRARQQWAVRLERALASERWSLAEAAMAQLLRQGLPVARHQHEAVNAGLGRANHFLRFLGWTLVGSLLVLLAAVLAAVLEAEVAAWLPRQLLGQALLSRTAVQWAVYLTALASFAFVLLAFLQACFRGPGGWPAATAGLALVSVFGGAGSLLWSTWHFNVLSVPGHPAGWATLALAAGAVLGYLAVTLVRPIVLLTPGPLTAYHRRAMLAGAVGLGLCFLGLHRPQAFLADLPVGVVGFGFLSLAGLAAPRGLFPFLLAAVLSGGAGAALAAAFGPVGWLPPGATVLALGCAGFFFSIPRWTPRNLICGTLLVLAAVLLHRNLAAETVPCALFHTWFFVNGILSAARFEKPSDHRLHVLDRVRAWRWKRSK